MSSFFGEADFLFFSIPPNQAPAIKIAVNEIAVDVFTLFVTTICVIT